MLALIRISFRMLRLFFGRRVAILFLTLTMPSDDYKRLLKGYKATGIVWAFVDLVRLIPVLHFHPRDWSV